MIQIILTSVAFSLFFITIHNIPRKWGINFKPFNCGSCLAAWTSIILYFAPELIVDICSLMFIGGVLAAIFELLLNKIIYG